MALKLYNTLSRKKEVFKPINERFVGIYTCGPTVYNYAHIGNLRTYLFEDFLKRVFLYNAFKTKHVMNITDVGHLTSDADEGEDKLVKALKREGKELNEKSMMELAEFYTKAFQKDIKRLNILDPDIWCKATEHINEMIELNKKLEKNGYTYKTSVGLIYNTLKFKNYAKLAKLKLKDLMYGKRVEKDEERRNPSDFALWITNQPKQIMQWDSPWGRGFPGWHLECSAMSMKYLGDTFDIHCGGIDHIPIHHTNEIAQSEGATGKKFVNYWLHGEFLILDKEKMAKSGEGFITLQTVVDKGFDPLSYRYLCLTAHYRSPLDFSWQNLKSASNSFQKWKERVREIKKAKGSKGEEQVSTYKKEFFNLINNDLDMPKALALSWGVIKDKKLGSKEKYDLLLDFDNVFGLGVKEIKEEEELQKEVMELINKRETARKQKNYKLADEIRKQLKNKGIILEDTPEGVRWKRI